MAQNIWQTEPFARLVRAQKRVMMRDHGVFDELVELLGSAIPFVRRDAAASLGGLGDERAIEYLLPLLGDGAYFGEGTPFIGTPTDDHYSVACGVSEALWRLGDAAVPPLRETLKSPNWRSRRWAIDALGRRRDVRLVGDIGNSLADAIPEVRRAAALALSLLDDGEAVPALQRARSDEDADVRRIATFALRKLGVLSPTRKPRPREQKHTFKLYADHFQFYLGDSRFDGDTAASQFWSPEAFSRGLAISPPSLLGIPTNRYDDVTVVVEVRKLPPEIDADLDTWDHVVEASLEVPSGRVAIDGCLAYSPEGLPFRRADDTVSPHISVWPGTYRARVYSGDLGSEGEHYQIVMWPAPYDQPVVLRDWTGST